jgi:hypothetical protein
VPDGAADFSSDFISGAAVSDLGADFLTGAGALSATKSSSGDCTGLAAAFLAAAFLAGSALAGAACFNSGNFCCKRFTTGASTVDDADLTYSPTCSNLAIISLLSKPRALASS